MSAKAFMIALVCTIPIACVSSVVLYSNNFESGLQGGGWTRTTVGDPAFHDVWSISVSVPAQAGNHYAAAVATVPRLPSNPGARWYGGLLLPLVDSSAIPQGWSLSFDVRESSADPIQLQLALGNGSSGYVPAYRAWVTPSSGDWCHVSIGSDQFTLGQASSFDAVADLAIMMSSQDVNGNPLALSTVGTHELDIDNVLFVAVPEPATLFC
jgi:hypothetical protein